MVCEAQSITVNQRTSRAIRTAPSPFRVKKPGMIASALSEIEELANSFGLLNDPPQLNHQQRRVIILLRAWLMGSFMCKIRQVPLVA